MPPAFNAKNRLYVERSAKHRRILSNFGLTFRNSKWSNYSRPNVSAKHRYSFVRLLLIPSFSILCIYTSFKIGLAGILSLPSLCMKYYYWAMADSVVQQLICFGWMFLFMWGFILECTIKWLIRYLFGLEQPKPFGVPESDSQERQLVFRMVTTSEARELMARHITSHWAGLTPRQHTEMIERCFSVRGLATWAQSYDMLAGLYDTTRLLHCYKQNANHISYLIAALTGQGAETVTAYIFKGTAEYDSSTGTRYGHMVTHYIHDTSDRFYESEVRNNRSLRFLHERYKYSLSNIDRELGQSNTYLVGLKGGFYIPSPTSSQMTNWTLNNPELRFLTHNLTNEAFVTNWLKWTYKTNLLHRHSVKMSTSLSLVKKLMTGGYYNHSLSTRNIWASSELGLNPNTSNFINQSSAFLYKNQPLSVAATSDMFSGLSYKQRIRILSTYEDSYAWFLHRFYTYNNLSTNQITSLPRTNRSLESGMTQVPFENYKIHLVNLTSLLRASGYDDNFMSTFNAFPKATDNEEMRRVSQLYASTVKDVTLVYKDSELLNTNNVRMLFNLEGVWDLRPISLELFKNK